MDNVGADVDESFEEERRRQQEKEREYRESEQQQQYQTPTETKYAAPVSPPPEAPIRSPANNLSSLRSTTPASPVKDDQVKFTKKYIFSLGGLIRLSLILAQFAGWVSAAAIPKIYNGTIHLPLELQSTRDGYLFFSISGFIIAIALYFLFLFNINKTGPFPHLPLNLIILVTDIIWLVPMFILSIVCAVREAGIKNPSYLYWPFVNTGAFASAAFFGFLCSLIYGIDAAVHLIRQLKKSNK